MSEIIGQNVDPPVYTVSRPTTVYSSSNDSSEDPFENERANSLVYDDYVEERR